MSIASQPVRAEFGRAPVDGILGAIGNTPLVALHRYLPRPDVEVFAKLESANPGGSAKDRPAARMLQDALDAGLIDFGTTVIESTSGNTGVGLAQACRYHGMRLICVVDDRAHERNVQTMRALGADVRVVTEPDPETGDLLVARLALVQRLLAEIPNSFWPDQYANESNPAAHAGGTMREIDEALDGQVDYVFVATSTTGTLRGCADYLREHGRATRARRGRLDGERALRRRPRRRAGCRASAPASRRSSRRPPTSTSSCASATSTASIGCRRLAEREAILAGASSGGVAYAMELLAPQMVPGSRCAAIFPDGGSGYLETVFDDGWVERELACTPARLAALVAEEGLPSLTCR